MVLASGGRYKTYRPLTLLQPLIKHDTEREAAQPHSFLFIYLLPHEPAVRVDGGDPVTAFPHVKVTAAFDAVPIDIHAVNAACNLKEKKTWGQEIFKLNPSLTQYKSVLPH
jgi:hypothetical protein